MTTPGAGVRTVREYALLILESGDLATKLLRPRAEGGGALEDDSPGVAVRIDRAGRDATLQMVARVGKLPNFVEVHREEAARRVCLERFAHHELMAVELFAWALVTWPEMPKPLRRAFLGVIADEQRHLELYLTRLADLGTGLGDSPLSDYLWRHAPAIRESSDGPLAFLCAMGLTFEQANLDFTHIYGDEFRRAGDDPSAVILDRIHREEIGHVRLAVDWLRRLKNPALCDWDAYRAAVPFPLAAHRAKGRRFDAEARRQAGLDESFIEGVRCARPGDNMRPPAP